MSQVKHFLGRSIFEKNVLPLLFTLYSKVLCYPPKTKTKFCVKLGSITLSHIVSTKTASKHKTYFSGDTHYFTDNGRRTLRDWTQVLVTGTSLCIESPARRTRRD